MRDNETPDDKGSWLLQQPWPDLGAKTMVMIISSVCSLPPSTQENPYGPRSSVQDRTLGVWPQMKFFVSSPPWLSWRRMWKRLGLMSLLDKEFTILLSRPRWFTSKKM
jgi:hypothetical protein